MRIIGADGGGTRTTVIVCDEKGRILERKRGDGINYNAIGFDAARENLRAAVDSAAPDGYDLMSVAFSALDNAATREETEQFAGEVFDAEKLLLDSDAFVSLVGASLDAPGIMLISGTGSMGTAIDSCGTRYSAGGWGYLLGDEGSGYDIGNQVIRAAIHGVENRRPTMLTSLITEYFKVRDIRGIIPIVYGENFAPRDIAAVGRFADIAAAEGDEVAAGIIRSAAFSMADIALYLRDLVGEVLPVYAYGGVFQHSVLFLENYNYRIAELDYPEGAARKPILPPECGAVILAAKRLGIYNNDFRTEILSEYQRYNEQIRVK